MLSTTVLVALVAVIALVYKVFNIYASYMRKIEAAKRSGFPYILCPVFPIGYGYIFLCELIILPLCARLPFTQAWAWTHMIGRRESYEHRRAAHEKYGDTYMLVCMNLLYLKTTNAELIAQITARKNDFVKPIKDYKVVDIFGKSLLSSEGADFRKHKKVVASSFSEKSSKFAFEESLRQADGMMDLWKSLHTNGAGDLVVDNTARDTAELSLHVICAAGFGVPQVWPHEDPTKYSDRGLPGFSSVELTNGHTMTFKESLAKMLDGLLNFAALDPWMLRISPFRFQRRVYKAYEETGMYFNELLDIKKKQVTRGEVDRGTMDLLGPMIRASDELPKDEKEKKSIAHQPILTRDEIISNSFIFFFAGHETSANSIHFSMVYLAISPPTQQHLQFDIDSIVGKKSLSEISYLEDMPRLYNSMVGAVMNEQLRLIPPIMNLPKVAVGGDRKVIIDKQEHIIAESTFVHLNVVGTSRNPRYYPYAPSWISGLDHDLDDFVPERWLSEDEDSEVEHDGSKVPSIAEEAGKASFENSSGGLFKPIKGSFIPFSEGARTCPGKRFAQVEITAVLTAIFQRYSVELDVGDWASDEEVEMMDDTQKRRVYERAIKRARQVLDDLEPVITLLMKPGDKVPLRFVERGRERFAYLYDE